MPSYIQQKTKQVLLWILDALFPIQCICCKQFSKHFACSDCLKSIRRIDNTRCPLCQKVTTQNGRTCTECFGKFSINGIFPASSFKNIIVKKLVHLCKYRFVKDASMQLGDILVRALEQSDVPLPDMIIPVPLHRRRLRWRGFNQSEYLARHLASSILPNATIPVHEDMLIRRRNSTPQAAIRNKLHRRKNMQNMFSIQKSTTTKNLLQGKRIWIVDDVFTTGATLFECAKTLKKHGASEVYGIVVAH